MKKVLGIVGAGDLGQQIAHYATDDKHYSSVVFFDDYTNEQQINGYQVLGKTDIIVDSYNNSCFDELIIGIGYKHLAKKKELYDFFKDKIPFATIVHSSSWVDKSAKIDDGTIIYPRCSIDANVHIGSNSVLNIGCTIAHDTRVSSHVFLSPRVAIAGFVNVAEKCIIGINSTIIDNIEIKENIQIGGGTTVIKSLYDAGLYVGNPARFIR